MTSPKYISTKYLLVHK